GKQIAVAVGKQIALIDLEGKNREKLLEGHEKAVVRVVFSADGNRLASAGADEVKIWDPVIGQELLVLTHPTLVRAVAFSPEGHRLAATCGKFTQGEVSLWGTGSP